MDCKIADGTFYREPRPLGLISHGISDPVGVLWGQDAHLSQEKHAQMFDSIYGLAPAGIACGGL